ncbi:MAG: hypothetical protein D6796_15440 [Caldilineae bacterium]|nr:MAG: hypothetical protein D6796_15440 [Caldilineae bacterium]
MLTAFDWLRQAETGAELLATLEYLSTLPDLPTDRSELGPPFSALSGPCYRCRVYAPAYKKHLPHPIKRYCRHCSLILKRAARLKAAARYIILIWGYVNRLPRQLRQETDSHQSTPFSQFILDEHHFLLVLHRRQLKPWLQDLVLYDGPHLRGLLQIFPPATSRTNQMGSLLRRINHHETHFGMGALRVRFYSAPHQVYKPYLRDDRGMLTFEVTEFLRLLEMAAIFQTILPPAEQKALRKLLSLENPTEQQFYWGRFLGYLQQEAKDMLDAWNIRHWSPHQIELLYELVNYVAYYQEY